MATAKWNKARGLWIIQGQKNGIKKSFYSATPGSRGRREVTEKYEDWLDFGGVQKMTVARCVDLYLRDIEARLGRGISWKTADQYTRLYVLPELGRCRMDKLTLRDFQALLNNATPKSGHVKTFSRKSLINFRGVLSGLHKFAYQNYYCDSWRGSLYIPQGHPKSEKEILQPEHIARLFEPSELWYAPAFRIMLLCGLRPGEALGLQEGDIRGSVLMISRAINDDGEITEGKNKNARRVVPLPPLAADILRETIARNHACSFGTTWIFPNGVGDRPSQNTMRKHWNKLKAERGLPGSPHSLRHTFVSIVSSQTHLAEGTIKTLVGHSEGFDTWGTYKHTVAGELENAAEVINLTFERLKTSANG